MADAEYGLRIITDNGEKINVLCYDEETDINWQSTYICLWSEEQSEYPSFTFTVNSMEFGYDSTNHRFKLADNNYIPAYSSATGRQTYVIPIYDVHNDDFYFARMDTGYSAGAMSRYIRRGVGTGIFQDTSMSYEQALAWMVEYLSTDNRRAAIFNADSSGVYVQKPCVLQVLLDYSGNARWDTTIFNYLFSQTTLHMTLAQFKAMFHDRYEEYDPNDPYNPWDDPNDPVPGDFDDTSDVIEDDPIPSVSMADTGFTRIYNPTLVQLKTLANKLWTDTTIFDTLGNKIKHYFENPMDSIITLNIVPCSVPNGDPEEVKLCFTSLGVNMSPATTQYVDVDCGTLDITNFYGSALDYSPNTRISIFLPFIGDVPLNVDDVMGNRIGVKYRIDIVSGECVAKVFVNGSIHYQFSGHCIMTVPVTAASFNAIIDAAKEIVKGASAIAAGATGHPELAAALGGGPMPTSSSTHKTQTTTMQSRNADTGRMRNVGRETTDTVSEHTSGASFGAIGLKNAGNMLGAIMSSKVPVELTNSFTGNSGLLGKRRPYVTIIRPRMCNPNEYGKFNGYPCMKYLKLGNCTGFTLVQQIQLTGIDATNPELDELEGFLKAGVIL